MFALMNKYNPSIFFGVPTLFSAMLTTKPRTTNAVAPLAHLHLRGRGAAGIGGNSWSHASGRYSRWRGRPSCCIFFSPMPAAISNTAIRPSGAGIQGAARQRSRQRCCDGEVGELLVDAPSAGEGYWIKRSKSRQTFEGHWTRTGDKYIRGRRCPLHLLRPQ